MFWYISLLLLGRLIASHTHVSVVFRKNPGIFRKNCRWLFFHRAITSSGALRPSGGYETRQISRAYGFKNKYNNRRRKKHRKRYKMKTIIRWKKNGDFTTPRAMKRDPALYIYWEKLPSSQTFRNLYRHNVYFISIYTYILSVIILHAIYHNVDCTFNIHKHLRAFSRCMAKIFISFYIHFLVFFAASSDHDHRRKSSQKWSFEKASLNCFALASWRKVFFFRALGIVRLILHKTN